MFTKKDREEPADPVVFPESGAKVLSVLGKPKELTKVLATRRELTEIQPLMSTNHCASPETTGLQPSPIAVSHSSFVTPVAENNRLVGAQKPSKFKDGRNKKTKEDLLLSSLKVKDGRNKKTKEDLLLTSSEYSAKSITISRKRSKEPTEAIAIEEKSARHDLNRMQTKSSTNDCCSPEMPSAMRIMPHFKVPHGSLVTPAVIHNQNEKIKADQNEKIKADRLVSPIFNAKFISMVKRPKKPTKGLATGDEPTRGELIAMQPLLSTDDCTAPEMTRLQPSGMGTIPGFKVRYSSLITPAIEPANKKRRLESNGLITSQKPFKVKDGRNRKFKADPLEISNRPEELTEALATEDQPARYELSGMQPLLLTDNCNCNLPEMTGLQSSATRTMAAYTVPHRSLVTPIVEPTNKKRPLENNGLVGAQKPSNIIDGRNKKIKCIFRKPKEPTESLLIEDRPARHELTGLQLFPSSDAFKAPKMTGLQDSATRVIPPCTVPQRLVVRTIVKPAIGRQNNGLVSVQKPPTVKESQRKKTKDNPQKPISLRKFLG